MSDRKPVRDLGVAVWLVAEFCSHDLFHGWWLYCRDNNEKKRNCDDGGWGWLHGEYPLTRVENLCREMGYSPPPAGRWSQALAEWFAQTFPDGLRVFRDRFGKYEPVIVPEPEGAQP